MRHLYKLVFIGDGGVGKTTTINSIFQYLQKKFSDCSCPTCQDSPQSSDRTTFIDFHTITFSMQDQKVVWQIWDLQGQRFPSNNAYTSLNPLDHITETVITNADLILLVFDSSSNATFNELFREQGFFDLIQPFFAPNQALLLLENKTDLLNNGSTDTVPKVATDRIAFTLPDPLPYNNTFLENISDLTEAMLTAMHLTPEALAHEPHPNQTPVSLKVYR